MQQDTYQTIAAPCMGVYKEKGSKFIAYAFEVHSEQDVKAFLEEVRQEHFKARHHCYAYRIGLEGKRFRANDDGEPSGTAGRPILGQIDSFGLANVLVIVVRYFGGTKLGTSGLKRAYKSSTIDALEQASIEERIVEQHFEVVFEYAATSAVMNFLKKEAYPIQDTKYNDQTQLTVRVRLSEIPRFEAGLKDIEGLAYTPIEA